MTSTNEAIIKVLRGQKGFDAWWDEIGPENRQVLTAAIDLALGIQAIPTTKPALATLDNKFRDALSELINGYSRENGSNTPDHILAHYLCGCLDAFDRAVDTRERWYGRDRGPELRLDSD